MSTVSLKNQEKKILKEVEEAISLAADDTGLLIENYGMLEERIQSYLNQTMFDRGYEIMIELDRELFLVNILEVIAIT